MDPEDCGAFCVMYSTLKMKPGPFECIVRYGGLTKLERRNA